MKRAKDTLFISAVFLALYLLSVGPVLGFAGPFPGHRLSVSIETAYAPLIWVGKMCPPFEGAIGEYAQFFLSIRSCFVKSDKGDWDGKNPN